VIKLPPMAECRMCHDPIRFVRMKATGKAMPVNPAPNPNRGTIAAHLAGGQLQGFVISKDNRPGPLDPFRFVPHYATCEEQRPKSTTTTPTTTPEPGLF
jgi:hypothetical protein